MVSDDNTFRLVEKRDVLILAVLTSIALVIGVYLIATNVLIAQDGVFYIEQARRFSIKPVAVIRKNPPAYPILIFVAHKLIVLFGGGSSVHTWIYCAQAVNLLCRLLAIIPLYFFGKCLFGYVRSFWAILVLIMLPHPAEYGSDALREWPYILFLAWGLFFLIWGVKHRRWLLFGPAGLASGVGYIFRPECAQVVVYGLLWLVTRFLCAKREYMTRSKLIKAVLILLIGFAFAAGPYMKVSERLFPPKLKKLIRYFHTVTLLNSQNESIAGSQCIYAAGSVPISAVKAVGKLIDEVSTDLIYFFAPVLVIGVYYRFYRESTASELERFFIPVFMVFNIVMLILLYCFYEFISGRHCLPLVAFLIFYVPIGLEALGNWLGGGLKHGENTRRYSRRWFFALLTVGLIICLPKLVRPMRIDKQGYREAAKWLNKNTAPTAIIAVPDKRIAFYAERKGMGYSEQIPERANYIVGIVKSENDKVGFGRATKEEYSTWVDKRKKNKRLVIWRVSRPDPVSK